MNSKKRNSKVNNRVSRALNTVTNRERQIVRKLNQLTSQMNNLKVKKNNKTGGGRRRKRRRRGRLLTVSNSGDQLVHKIKSDQFSEKFWTAERKYKAAFFDAFNWDPPLSEQGHSQGAAIVVRREAFGHLPTTSSGSMYCRIRYETGGQGDIQLDYDITPSNDASTNTFTTTKILTASNSDNLTFVIGAIRIRYIGKAIDAGGICVGHLNDGGNWGGQVLDKHEVMMSANPFKYHIRAGNWMYIPLRPNVADNDATYGQHLASFWIDSHVSYQAFEFEIVGHFQQRVSDELLPLIPHTSANVLPAGRHKIAFRRIAAPRFFQSINEVIPYGEKTAEKVLAAEQNDGGNLHNAKTRNEVMSFLSKVGQGVENFAMNMLNKASSRLEDSLKTIGSKVLNKGEELAAGLLKEGGALAIAL